MDGVIFYEPPFDVTTQRPHAPSDAEQLRPRRISPNGPGNLLVSLVVIALGVLSYFAWEHYWSQKKQEAASLEAKALVTRGPWRITATYIVVPKPDGKVVALILHLVNAKKETRKFYVDKSHKDYNTFFEWKEGWKKFYEIPGAVSQWPSGYLTITQPGKKKPPPIKKPR